MNTRSRAQRPSDDRPRRTPPVELLTRGRVPLHVPMIVAYADQDASGELRYVEQLVTRPIDRYSPAA